jgi:hypothetical protein
MGLLDFILFPVYVTIFYFIFIAGKNNNSNPILKYYYKQGYWIKVFAVLAFTLFNTVISKGDSFGLYYTEGVNIYHMILRDFSQSKLLFLPGKDFDQTLLKNQLNRGYFRAENNYLVTVFVAALSFISFGKYLIINFFFAMIAYSGIWRLYLFFYNQFPDLHKQLAIAILYLPTFVFWSSGILKDPLCISALGWITYSMYEIFYKKNNIIKNSVIILIFGYLLAILKIYILVSYVPFFTLFLILKNVNLLKNRVFKWGLAFALIAGSIVAGQKIMENFKEEMGAFAAEDISKQVGRQRSVYRDETKEGGGESSFSLGVEMDGSMSSLIKVAPAAIIATFYRPFIWESRKISTLLSSLESMFIMFFTLFVLYKAGPLRFFQAIRKDPVILYCILFSLLFGLFVGATTANFGSLVRYKIPCMPFYVIALILIRNYTKKSPTDNGAL